MSSTKFPVVHKREVRDQEGVRRVSSMRVGLTNHQSTPCFYVTVHLGFYDQSRNDARVQPYDLPISAAAQLSRLLDQAVQEHLYGTADPKDDQN